MEFSRALGQSYLSPAYRRRQAAEFSTPTPEHCNQHSKRDMPGKELTDPCVDCRDTESVLSVRSRRLCKYVGKWSTTVDGR